MTVNASFVSVSMPHGREVEKSKAKTLLRPFSAGFKKTRLVFDSLDDPKSKYKVYARVATAKDIEKLSKSDSSKKNRFVLLSIREKTGNKSSIVALNVQSAHKRLGISANEIRKAAAEERLEELINNRLAILKYGPPPELPPRPEDEMGSEGAKPPRPTGKKPKVKPRPGHSTESTKKGKRSSIHFDKSTKSEESSTPKKRKRTGSSGGKPSEERRVTFAKTTPRKGTKKLPPTPHKKEV